MRSERSVETAFAWSMTIMVSASSLILAFAEENRLPSALTPLMAVGTHFVVDKWKLLRLPVWTTNVLGVIAFSAMLYEFVGGDVLTKLFSGAHLLVYMTWVVLLMPKGIRQFWWLLALGVLQISVASVLTTSGSFGAALVGMLLLMTWTMSVFTLFRARQRMRRSDGSVEDSLAVPSESVVSSNLIVRDGLQLDDREPWMGWRFRSIVAFTFAASLVVAGVTFAAFPRIWVNESPLAALNTDTGNGLSSRVGFNEEVRLGAIGQIMQSDERALQFEISRMDDGSAVTPEEFAAALNMDEILFRGTALGHYRDGRWTSEIARGSQLGFRIPVAFNGRAADSDFRVHITQDPPIEIFAFTPTPANNIRVKSGGKLTQRHFWYSVQCSFAESRRHVRDEPLEFEVWCRKAVGPRVAHGPSQAESASEHLMGMVDSLMGRGGLDSQQARAWCITPNLDRALPRVTEIANRLCRNEQGELIPPRERIQKVMAFLNTSGEFRYSHTLSRANRAIDPVEDFLLNTKAGHCEYFASACALLLQAVDVPARVVNGYKGSDLNSVSGRYEVKQKYAHAWNEVFVSGRWETLDPTPAAAREEIVGQSGQFDWWSDLGRAFDDNWMNMVQKMNLQRQEAMIRPWLDSIKGVWEGIKERGLLASLKMFYHEVILKPGTWLSWRTWLVTFVVLLIPSLLTRANPLKSLYRWMRQLLGAGLPSQRQQKTVIRFYENFCNACAKHGLTFPRQQTARENAHMAIEHFADRLPESSDRDLPIRIAQSFNSVRFGEQTLPPDAIAAIRRDVSRFTDLISVR